MIRCDYYDPGPPPRPAPAKAKRKEPSAAAMHRLHRSVEVWHRQGYSPASIAAGLNAPDRGYPKPVGRKWRAADIQAMLGTDKARTRTG